MNSPVPADNASPGWKRWALVGAALSLLLLLALGWWWMQASGAADQRTRLQAALDRQRELSAELARIKPADPQDCPPGQTLRPIGNVAPPAAAAGSAPTAAAPPPPSTGEVAASAGERSKPAGDGPLAGVQYQKWSYRVDFIGMPIQMPAREFSNCLDRDSASTCSFDDPKSACKQTTLERVGNTQKVHMDCPDTKGLATFVWAGDGMSWSGTLQMEGAQVPPGMGMRISAKYVEPCAQKDIRRPPAKRG